MYYLLWSPHYRTGARGFLNLPIVGTRFNITSFGTNLMQFDVSLAGTVCYGLPVILLY